MSRSFLFSSEEQREMCEQSIKNRYHIIFNFLIILYNGRVGIYQYLYLGGEE